MAIDREAAVMLDSTSTCIWQARHEKENL